MKNVGGTLSDKRLKTAFRIDPEDLGRSHREAKKDAHGRYLFDINEQLRDLAQEVDM